jgi:hypothetical protein
MVGVYVLLEDGKQRFLQYAATVAAWTVTFAGLMLFFFSQLLPPAYRAGLDFSHQFVLGSLAFCSARREGC